MKKIKNLFEFSELTKIGFKGYFSLLDETLYNIFVLIYLVPILFLSFPLRLLNNFFKPNTTTK